MAFKNTEINSLIRHAVRDVPVNGKIGQKVLQPLIAEALMGQGFNVDVEDKLGFMPSGLAAWRDKEDFQIVPTPGRRRIDIVVRNANEIVALIETESDLDDLREVGVSRRSGHYDVASIAKNTAGDYFSSYKSIERMAVAAYCSRARSVFGLEQLCSDAPEDHNPTGIELILVTGRSRAMDRRILKPRLASLNADLISVVAGS